jgi:hypothetical protein
LLIKLLSQATTTPKIRAAIQASDEPAWVLSDRYVWLLTNNSCNQPWQQIALAGDEGLAQTQARAVQEAAILHSRM